MNAERSLFEAAAGTPRDGAGRVVAFPGSAPRRFRREAVEADAARGQILLFTGVRYERLPDPDAGVNQRRRRS